LLDIKKYFGRRGSDDYRPNLDEEITKEAPMKIRGDKPGTTTFNRNAVIGLSAALAVIFIGSMIYAMSSPAPDKQKEEAIKDKKVTAINQPNSQLDRLPSGYDSKSQHKTPPPVDKADNSAAASSLADNYIPTRPYPSIDYSAASQLPSRPPAIPGQMFTPPASAIPSIGVPVIQSAVNKEEQELEEARKSPIRFNLN
jgi:hypothetical protein